MCQCSALLLVVQYWFHISSHLPRIKNFVLRWHESSRSHCTMVDVRFAPMYIITGWTKQQQHPQKYCLTRAKCTAHSTFIYYTVWLVGQVSSIAVHSTPSGEWPPKNKSTHRSSRLLPRMILARLYWNDPAVDISVAATTAVIKVV